MMLCTRRTWNGPANDFFNGQIDKHALFNRPLTPDELTFEFNGGFGRLRTEYDADLTAALVSYHEMEEGSGATRLDSHGTFDMTDNNTVGVTTGVPTL